MISLNQIPNHIDLKRLLRAIKRKKLVVVVENGELLLDEVELLALFPVPKPRGKAWNPAQGEQYNGRRPARLMAEWLAEKKRYDEFERRLANDRENPGNDAAN